MLQMGYVPFIQINASGPVSFTRYRRRIFFKSPFLFPLQCLFIMYLNFLHDIYPYESGAYLLKQEGFISTCIIYGSCTKESSHKVFNVNDVGPIQFQRSGSLT